MKAMILAAGRGSRMAVLNSDLPKPLLKVGEKSLIEHRLEGLKKAGVTELIINIHHLAEKIQATLGNGARYGVKIHYSFEAELLETGGGICQALPLLGDQPFIVVSADTFSDYPFEKLVEHPLKGLAHLVLVDNPPHHSLGDFGLDQEYVSLSAATKLNYAGFALIHPRLFAGLSVHPFKLSSLFHTAIEARQITGEYYRGLWMNVDTPERLEAVRKLPV